MCISKKTETLLKKAGWNNDRKIDISDYVETLMAGGYILNDVVKEFLSKFGGLRVCHPHAKVVNEDDNFHLDPIGATKSILIERVNSYEERVEEKLVVIGEAHDRHMVLMMSLSGKMYAGYDDFLVEIGENGYTALETLCEGKETSVVP